MNILQEARVRQGFTQVQLAKVLGVTSRIIGSYEQGQRHPKAMDLLKVAKAYGLSDEEIILYLKQVAR